MRARLAPDVATTGAARPLQPAPGMQRSAQIDISKRVA